MRVLFLRKLNKNRRSKDYEESFKVKKATPATPAVPAVPAKPAAK